MGLMERIGTGVFVGLAIFWYLIAPESLDCTDMQTGETLEGCVSFFSPLMTYFCALPPLVLAVFIHTLSKGGESKPSLQHLAVDEEGRAIMPEQKEVRSQQETIEFSFRMAMNFGGFSFASAYAFIFIVGLLAIPQLLLCGMMGSSCSDSDFSWAENGMDLGYTVMTVGFWVFLVSAVATFGFRNLNAEAGFSTSPALKKQQENVIIPCPSCEKRLRLPANYSGEIQCPNCEHVFSAG